MLAIVLSNDCGQQNLYFNIFVTFSFQLVAHSKFMLHYKLNSVVTLITTYIM